MPSAKFTPPLREVPPSNGVDPRTVRVGLGGADHLFGDLYEAEQPKGLVLVAHGSGSGRMSPRNRYVAVRLLEHRISSLLVDLLTEEEADEDQRSGTYRFDIPLLAERVEATVAWVHRERSLTRLPLGLYGASTGGAAAMVTAAKLTEEVSALVLRGARTDLADLRAPDIRCPTLVLVGEADPWVEQVNRATLQKLRCVSRLVVVPGASHLFEEPGAMSRVASETVAWFLRYLSPAPGRPGSEGETDPGGVESSNPGASPTVAPRPSRVPASH